MCSSQKVKFDIISKLEDCLTSDSFNSLCVGGFKFYTVSKGHKVSDYICYASNHQCALPTLQVLEMKLFELIPWLKDFIKVNVAPHGFTLSLSRIGCFLNGLRDVELLGSEYGFSSMFNNEVFICSIVKTRVLPDSLYGLRLKLVLGVLQNVILACGGTFDLMSGSEKDILKVILNNKDDVETGSINILVGPVKTDITNLSLDLYKSLRMKDIIALCEHKFDDVTISEEKNQILNAAIVFDLLQFSTQRSVSLHLSENDIDKRTSCKGSIFILYNYARLYSLCARFDNCVSAGIYPDLPKLENIDFTLLSLEDEWQLMFESILCWPSVLKKSIIGIKCGKPKLHLIFNFLKTITTIFSQYYHRTRVLMEPRDHLLPVLFARMRLLKSLLQIYQNAFNLINVSPLKKM